VTEVDKEQELRMIQASATWNAASKADRKAVVSNPTFPGAVVLITAMDQARAGVSK
jgi:hypothetical protein